MTIRKGEQWGRSVPRPERIALADSDRGLAQLLSDGAPGPFGVTGGDLYRTVGAPDRRSEVMRLPIDALRIVADGTPHVAVAHVIARRSWWRGGVVAIMNVDHLGEWNVAPRAHPNDGRFDVIEVDASMSVRQRLQARTRIDRGAHLPHPKIASRAGVEGTWHFDRPQRLYLDGVLTGSVRDLTVEIEPDRFAIHV